jgi:hypothetical protein
MPDQQTDPKNPETAPATLQAAISTFNAADYFACHEFLEALWLNEQDPRRDLYKGILQIGIGLLHLRQENIKGAKNLLYRGCELIDPYTPTCFGIALSTLQSDARSILCRLEDSHAAHSFLAGDAIQILTV